MRRGPHSHHPEYLWIYPKINSQLSSSLEKEFHINPLLSQLFISRGFASLDEVHTFLYSKLPDLCDPMLLCDMEKAIVRINKAIASGEHILVYGDNDVDGMTGTAVLTEFLRTIGGKASFFIPNSNTIRKDLFVDSLDFALENNCTLMITVDCGVTAWPELSLLTDKGIDIIVTDHHESTTDLPKVVAILNPKVSSTYPNRDLTGVGVAFKLAHALVKEHVASKKLDPTKVDLKTYLDLVALGTISDMGTLRGENRIFVQYGLKELHKGSRVGLAKLFKVCDLDFDDVSPGEIASKLAPRLNSLGRIANPVKGVKLLLMHDDADAAQALALEFDLLNTKRQKIERQVQDEIDEILLKKPEIFDNKAIIMYSESWHPGVIAIVATRITKQYNRPTVVITVDDGIGKGSIRSIPEFPLLPALKKVSHLLSNFGGHDFAAGLTIKVENIAEFKREFIAIANETLKDNDIVCKLMIDAKVDFEYLTFDLLESFTLLKPYGNGNPPPILYSNVKQDRFPKIISNAHLKMYFRQEDRVLEGIAFWMAHRAPTFRRKNLALRVAFTPQINTFHNKSSIQLLVRDVKIVS